MGVHSHQFIEHYQGLVGFGMNRETDEYTVAYYLQKFSDDQLLTTIKTRLTDDELAAIFDLLSELLRKHLNDQEYHKLFLKDTDDDPNSKGAIC
jgi:hypothetical protein